MREKEKTLVTFSHNRLCPFTVRCYQLLLFFFSFNPFQNKPWFFTCLRYKPFENTAAEKEKLLITSNFSFSPQCYLPVWRTFCHFHHIQNRRLHTLSVWKRQTFVVWERVKKNSLSSSYPYFSPFPTTFSTSSNMCRICLVVSKCFVFGDFLNFDTWLRVKGSTLIKHYFSSKLSNIHVLYFHFL